MFAGYFDMWSPGENGVKRDAMILASATWDDVS